MRVVLLKEKPTVIMIQHALFDFVPSSFPVDLVSVGKRGGYAVRPSDVRQSIQGGRSGFPFDVIHRIFSKGSKFRGPPFFVGPTCGGGGGAHDIQSLQHLDARSRIADNMTYFIGIPRVDDILPVRLLKKCNQRLRHAGLERKDVRFVKFERAIASHLKSRLDFQPSTALIARYHHSHSIWARCEPALTKAEFRSSRIFSNVSFSTGASLSPRYSFLGAPHTVMSSSVAPGLSCIINAGSPYSGSPPTTTRAMSAGVAFATGSKVGLRAFGSGFAFTTTKSAFLPTERSPMLASSLAICAGIEVAI